MYDGIDSDKKWQRNGYVTHTLVGAEIRPWVSDTNEHRNVGTLRINLFCNLYEIMFFRQVFS